VPVFAKAPLNRNEISRAQSSTGPPWGIAQPRRQGFNHARQIIQRSRGSCPALRPIFLPKGPAGNRCQSRGTDSPRRPFVGEGPILRRRNRRVQGRRLSGPRDRSNPSHMRNARSGRPVCMPHQAPIIACGAVSTSREKHSTPARLASGETICRLRPSPISFGIARTSSSTEAQCLQTTRPVPVPARRGGVVAHARLVLGPSSTNLPWISSVARQRVAQSASARLDTLA